jgi:hypothetical protein
MEKENVYSPEGTELGANLHEKLMIDKSIFMD